MCNSNSFLCLKHKIWTVRFFYLMGDPYLVCWLETRLMQLWILILRYVSICKWLVIRHHCWNFFIKTNRNKIKKFTFLWISSTRQRTKGVLIAQPWRELQGLWHRGNLSLSTNWGHSRLIFQRINSEKLGPTHPPIDTGRKTKLDRSRRSTLGKQG